MKIKVYVMHSEKIDYKNLIYKPLLERQLMKECFLILPLAEKYKSTYIKELLKDSDIVICDLTKFNFFANIELNTAIKLNKDIYYFINKNDNKLKKYKDLNINIYENQDDFANKVKDLISRLNKKEILLKRENIYCLGKIQK